MFCFPHFRDLLRLCHSKAVFQHQGWPLYLTRALQSTYPAHCICIYLRAVLICACMCLLTRPVCRKHMACSAVGAVNRCGQQNTLFVMLVGRAKDSKHTEASISPTLTGSLCLYVAQMPRTREVAIFVPTTDDRRQQMMTDKTDCFTPCACAQGNITIQLTLVVSSSVLLDIVPYLL